MRHSRLRNRAILGGLLFLAVIRFASASVQGPIISYFPSADMIYLVRVDSDNKGQVDFFVTETLRGTAKKSLELDAGFPDVFKPGSKWLLLSCSPWREVPRRNEVGTFFKGTVGWIYVSVQDRSDNVFKAMTVEQIKQALAQNPQKPWPK